MKIIWESDRRTGRTSRMIEEAVRLSKQGRAVYIIAESERECMRIAKMLGSDNPCNCKNGIKIETPTSCGNFCWETLSLRGAHPNCVVLIDHFAVEEEIRKRLSGLSMAIGQMNKYDIIS